VSRISNLHHVLAGLLRAHLRGHHLEELVEVDSAVAVGVDFVDHLHDGAVLRVEAERAHGHLDLVGVDRARPVDVEQVECVAALLDFFG
jgi:hypothetical protein